MKSIFSTRSALMALMLTGVALLISGCGSSSTSQSSISNPAAQLKTLLVDPPSNTIALGQNTQFSATGIYTDGTQKNLTEAVIWTSSNPSVAEVSNSITSARLTTAVGQGTAAIRASLGAVAGQATITVGPPSLQFIAVTPVNASLARGATQQFTAIGIYSDESTRDLSNLVSWSSGNGAVASISNAAGSFGLATGLGVGTTAINATLGSLSGSTSLTVTVTVTTLVSINVSPQTASVSKGGTQTFVATGTYSDGSTQNLTAQVTWNSSAPSVAAVNAAGLATSTAIGSTQLSAQLGGIAGSASLTVNPAALVSIAVTPATPSIPKRSTQAFTAIGNYTDGTTQVLTSTAAWTSANTGIATIGNTGIATGVGVGTTIIHAVQSGVTSANVTLTVTPALQYVYATDAAAGTVLQYGIGTSGALTPSMPASVTAGIRPFSIAVDPSNTYLFVANYVSSTLSAYQIGSDGALTPVGTPVTTGTGPNGIVVDPSGQYVYTANFDANTVSRFTLNAGVLTSAGPDIPAGNGPSSIAIDPSGSYAYVANYYDGSITEYCIGTGGVLTAGGTTSGLNNPWIVVVDPSAHYVYTTNSGGNTVSEFSIGTQGALTALTPATVTVSLGNPFGIAISPNGQYVYVTSVVGSNPGILTQFALGTDGQLSPITSPVATGVNSQFVAVDLTGQYVFVTNRGVLGSISGTLSQYTINADGSVTPLGSPIAAGTAPTAILTAY